jgi:hypothetical protein
VADAAYVYTLIGDRFRFCPREGTRGGYWYESCPDGWKLVSRDKNAHMALFWPVAHARFATNDRDHNHLGNVGPLVAAVITLSLDPRVRGPVQAHWDPAALLTDDDMARGAGEQVVTRDRYVMPERDHWPESRVIDLTFAFFDDPHTMPFLALVAELDKDPERVAIIEETMNTLVEYSTSWHLDHACHLSRVAHLTGEPTRSSYLSAMKYRNAQSPRGDIARELISDNAKHGLARLSAHAIRQHVIETHHPDPGVLAALNQLFGKGRK